MRRTFRGSGGLAFALAAGLTAASCGDGSARTSEETPDAGGGEAGAEASAGDGGEAGRPGGGEAGQGGDAGAAGASGSSAGAGGEGASAGSGEGGAAGDQGSAAEGGLAGAGGSAGEADSGDSGAANEGGVGNQGGALGEAGAAQAGETGEAGGSGSSFCPRLEAPENGSVDDGGAIYGAIAVYMCDRGYRREMTGLRVCLPSGAWSGTPDICDRLTCDPISFSGGTVTYDPPDRGCDAEATFSCNTGTLSDDNPRSCTCESGVWEPEPPTCD